MDCIPNQQSLNLSTQRLSFCFWHDYIFFNKCLCLNEDVKWDEMHKGKITPRSCCNRGCGGGCLCVLSLHCNSYLLHQRCTDILIPFCEHDSWWTPPTFVVWLHPPWHPDKIICPPSWFSVRPKPSGPSASADFTLPGFVFLHYRLWPQCGHVALVILRQQEPFGIKCDGQMDSVPFSNRYTYLKS